MAQKIQAEKNVELKYRNRIIELEKQLEFVSMRADQYQNKYEQSMLAEKLSVQFDFISDLKEKQEIINQLRKENLQLNVNIHSGNSIKKVDECFRQNQELREIIQELKAAAISAIMEKDAEIQELKNQATDVNLMTKLEVAQEKNCTLEHQISEMKSSYDKQIQQLYQKIHEERTSFAIKLENLHGEIHQEEAIKKDLEEKATNLVGDLESLEKQVIRFQKRAIELQNQLSNQKIKLAQTQHNLKIKTEEVFLLHQEHDNLCKSYERIQKKLSDKEEKIEQLKEQNEELDRKLMIKKRKNEQKEKKNCEVLQSFDEFSRKADLASSFVMTKKEVTSTIFGIAESFIEKPVKLSDIQEITEIENLDLSEFSDPDINIKLNSGNDSTTDLNQQNQSSLVNQLEKQNSKLKQNIESYLFDINRLNQSLEKVNKQLLRERQLSILHKISSNKAQSQLIVERESLRLHINKLENALLTEKLQNAERLEANRQIQQGLKKYYEEEMRKLRIELQLQPKKKKGFFK